MSRLPSDLRPGVRNVQGGKASSGGCVRHLAGKAKPTSDDLMECVGNVACMCIELVCSQEQLKAAQRDDSAPQFQLFSILA